MNSYNKIYFEKIAKEKGFVRDNLEKVMRLSEILQYFNQNEFLHDSLVLKRNSYQSHRFSDATTIC